jgi:hypothetical protein
MPLLIYIFSPLYVVERGWGEDEEYSSFEFPSIFQL